MISTMNTIINIYLLIHILSSESVRQYVTICKFVVEVNCVVFIAHRGGSHFRSGISLVMY